MKRQLVLSGKASQVFRYLELVLKVKGNITVKELLDGRD